MIFIVTLIALLVERFFHWHYLRHWRWANRYEQWLNGYINRWPAILILIINLLPPLVLVGVVECLLDDWVYGILRLIFCIFILLYCLGPQNLWVQVYHFMQGPLKNEANPVDTLQTTFNVILPKEKPLALPQAVIRVVTVAAYNRIFSVIFWFALLGPLGAVFYRLIDFFSQIDSAAAPLALKIKKILDWIPVRILTFIFALTGHFTHVFIAWKESLFKSPDHNENLLADCSFAALSLSGPVLDDANQAAKETLALLDRSFLIWLVALAVLVLIF